MKKLATAFEVFGVIIIIVVAAAGLGVTSLKWVDDELLACVIVWAIGEPIGLFCLAQSHYLNTLADFKDYLAAQRKPMPPIPQPFPAQFAPQAPVAPQPQMQPMQPVQPVQPPVQTPPQQ